MRLTFIALIALLGCSGVEPPQGWQQRLAQQSATPPEENFPLAPEQLEALMQGQDFVVRGAEPAGSGIMGALRIELYFPELDQTLSFKWKVAPPGGDGWNNTPRREIAAYQIQKWFLEPDEYVVPTTVATCLPLEVHAEIDGKSGPNLPGANCVFGTLSVWLDQVEESDRELLDERRFYREPRYARALSQYNLLSYLILNRDTRRANRLVSSNGEAVRFFAIDNGISFGEGFYNFFARHWNTIRVPALPRDSIERLRRVDHEQLQALRVVAQFELDGDGVLREFESTAAFLPEQGVRWRGGVLQIGLETDEIEGLRERIDELIEEVDERDILLF